MDKLIIHETDSHGGGSIHYNGITRDYTYDDGELGDVRRTIENLIEIGFIKKEDVEIFDCNRDIYPFVKVPEKVGE